jgi:hypothetical protein
MPTKDRFIDHPTADVFEGSSVRGEIVGTGIGRLAPIERVRVRGPLS